MEATSTPAASVTRRGFLLGGAAAALAAGGLHAGTGAGVALADDVPASIAENASYDEKGNIVPLGGISPVTFEGYGHAPIAPEGTPDAWAEEHEVVIVGLGGGGCTAALKLAEHGVDVLGIDKAPSHGGGTQEATTISIGGTKAQLEAGQTYDAEERAEAMANMLGNNSANMPVCYELARRAPQMADWLADEYGVPWEPEPTYPHDGIVWKDATKDQYIARAIKPTLDVVYENAERLGAQFRLSTTLVNLVKEDGRITGVKVRDLDGNAYYIRATTAVILASGGMMNNRQMLREYCPTVIQRCLGVLCNPTDTGEGIRMALGAGAQVSGWDSYMSFDGSTAWRYWNHYLYQGDVQLYRQPWLGIDQEGKRYYYYDNRNKELGAGTMLFQAQILQSLPNHRGYLIFDDKYEQTALQFGQVYCRKLVSPGDFGVDRVPEELGVHDWRDGAREAIEAGIVKKADTLEELAELMDMDPQIYVDAVAHWNEICAAGVDDELGFPEDFLVPVDTPPYYSCVVGSYPGTSHCGPRVNERFQVMGTDGHVLPGLYAVGATAGGTGGESTYGICCMPTGDAGLTFTSGYIAALDIVGA